MNRDGCRRSLPAENTRQAVNCASSDVEMVQSFPVLLQLHVDLYHTVAVKRGYVMGRTKPRPYLAGSARMPPWEPSSAPAPTPMKLKDDGDSKQSSLHVDVNKGTRIPSSPSFFRSARASSCLSKLMRTHAFWKYLRSTPHLAAVSIT